MGQIEEGYAVSIYILVKVLSPILTYISVIFKLVTPHPHFQWGNEFPAPPHHNNVNKKN